MMRDALKGIRPQIRKLHPHRGLWFDTLAPGFTSEDHGPFLKEVSELAIPPAYRGFHRQWALGLEQAGAKRFRAKPHAPVIVGLGSESVTEVAISLHRTYGVPILPGSALKGLAASFARNRMDPDLWAPEGEAYKTLFGTTEEAGHVMFFDALPVFGDQQAGDLRRDVITVHHPDYYQSEKGVPADWDSPTPVPFLVAACDFEVPLAGPEAWVEAARSILALALAEEGIGAKTSSGYGRFELQSWPARAPKGPKAGETSSSAQTQPEKTEGLSAAEILAQKFNKR
jgi:CRISPR-associated protein Cmr6